MINDSPSRHTTRSACLHCQKNFGPQNPGVTDKHTLRPLFYMKCPSYIDHNSREVPVTDSAILSYTLMFALINYKFGLNTPLLLSIYACNSMYNNNYSETKAFCALWKS